MARSNSDQPMSKWKRKTLAGPLGRPQNDIRQLSRLLFISLLLAAFTLAVYWPVLGHDFVYYDDPLYFSGNPRVLAGLTWNGLGWAFRAWHLGNWHPLIWLSFMLDVNLFGTGAAGPHFTNLLLHAVNAVLLFLLLKRLTGAHWRSALVAALFALHPLHVESVAWVTERKDVLSTSFGFLSLLFYVRYAQARVGNKEQGARSKNHNILFSFLLSPYSLSLIFFALGLMSKPMLVTLPFVMLLLDYWPLKRIADFGLRISDWRLSGLKRFQLSTFSFQLFLEKLPFFALSAIFSVITFLAQKSVTAVAPLADLSLTARIQNTCVSYARYLGKTVWPFGLANPYPFPAHWPAPDIFLGVVLVIGLSVAAVRLARFRPWCFVGWFWFFGMLLPVSGLVQTGFQSMADRYTYLPLVGLFIIFAWGAAELAARRLFLKRTVVMAILCLLAAGAVRTRDQVRYWQDTETLFGRALAMTTDNDIAWFNLGCYQSAQGRVEEAMADYRRAIQCNPKNVEAWNNLGGELAILGRTDEAAGCFTHALQINPNHFKALNNFGQVCQQKGRLAEAIDYYRRALRIQPDSADALVNLGLALDARQEPAAAMADYEAALRADPDHAQAHNELGLDLANAGRWEEAIRHYAAAVRLKPGYVEAHANLGDALARLGRRVEAIAQLQEALRLKPDYDDAKQKLRELGVSVSE